MKTLQVVAQNSEMKVAAECESKATINGDGGGVIGEGMQDGRLALGENVLHHRGHEGRGVAATAEVRMRADGADLNIPRKAEALAGHGDQPAFMEDSEKDAELDGAEVKRARFGERGKVYHLACVGRGECAHFYVERQQMWLALRRFIADHLV